jgi:hypothetical protein
MTFVGCDLHSRKQQVAVLDTTTGEILERELVHDGDAVEDFYRSLRPPVTIGIETTGYTQWFHALMHRLGDTVLVGEAGKIRAMSCEDEDRSARRSAPARPAETRSLSDGVDAEPSLDSAIRRPALRLALVPPELIILLPPKSCRS